MESTGNKGRNIRFICLHLAPDSYSGRLNTARDDISRTDIKCNQTLKTGTPHENNPVLTGYNAAFVVE